MQEKDAAISSAEKTEAEFLKRTAVMRPSIEYDITEIEEKTVLTVPDKITNPSHSEEYDWIRTRYLLNTYSYWGSENRESECRTVYILRGNPRLCQLPNRKIN